MGLELEEGGAGIPATGGGWGWSHFTGGLPLQGMGVAFSSAAAGVDDDDLVLCSVRACECLDAVFMLPKFPSALGIFETMVTHYPTLNMIIMCNIIFQRLVSWNPF